MDINWYDWKNARPVVFIKTTVGSELAQTDLKNVEIRTANDEVSLSPWDSHGASVQVVVFKFDKTKESNLIMI